MSKQSPVWTLVAHWQQVGRHSCMEQRIECSAHRRLHSVSAEWRILFTSHHKYNHSLSCFSCLLYHLLLLYLMWMLLWHLNTRNKQRPTQQHIPKHLLAYTRQFFILVLCAELNEPINQGEMYSSQRAGQQHACCSNVCRPALPRLLGYIKINTHISETSAAKILKSYRAAFESWNNYTYSVQAALVMRILDRSLLSAFNCLPLVIAEWWEAAGCLLHFPGVVRQVLTYTAAPQRAGSL